MQPTTFKGQKINNPPITTVYESLKGVRIPKEKEDMLLEMVYKLKRNYFLSSKALQQCNLKNEYMRNYITKYNEIIDKIVGN